MVEPGMVDAADKYIVGMSTLCYNKCNEETDMDSATIKRRR
jgi:hypothetical protein